MITVDDQKMDWNLEMTVKDLLDTIEHTQFCAAVRLNGKLVSSPFFDTTVVPDNSTIYLMPLIAGG